MSVEVRTGYNISVVETVGSVQELDPQAYLLFNHDVGRAGLTAEHHFVNYGLAEGRMQYANADAIIEARRQKLARTSFRSPPSRQTKALQMDFLSDAVRADFAIPENPPIAGNDYNSEILQVVQQNQHAAILDVGAGLRYTYHHNVVNAEIWGSASTDVICVGEDLPFTDEQFDFVFCFAVLEHTKRPWLAVDELIRVTKPGGQIWIDWPFLQPVHGYPHHFFNATPMGHTSLFEGRCDIISSIVKLWQHPIFSLTWMLNEWRAGLPEDALAEFDATRLGDLIGSGTDHVAKSICSRLSGDAQKVIAAGTTVVARKR